MGKSTIRTGADSFVASIKPSSNYTGSGYEHIQAPGSGTMYSYIRFNNPVPRGGTVTSVKLHLFGAGNWGASAVPVSIQRVSQAWIDSKVNYNNRPGVTGPVVTVTQLNPASGTEWVFDITALWQVIASGSAPNYGLRVSTSSTTQRLLYGFQASSYKPFLEVTWSDSPDAPTEMSPAGGASTTLAQPVLTFNFHDVSGSTAMGSCQVQINPTNSFTAPAFDSGEVPTSDPELDLSTTAYAGLAVGSTAWWRVRVKDAAGLWSSWSDPVYFVRGTRGALTLNSPTGGVIQDPTQEVLWSVSGATQTAWQVVIEDDSNPGKPIYDTGRRSGTDSAWTIPKGIITDESTTYRLTVRTWDDLSRTATPGDKIHTEVVNAFAFSNNGPIDTVHNMQLIPRPSGQPGMYVRWDRDNAPDHFEVRRADTVGGPFHVEDTDLDPNDLLVSGTTYQYLDRTATPYWNHSWRVICKTSSGMSYGPVISGKFDIDTTWLEDVDTGKLVPILFRDNDDIGSWDAPQIAVVAQPNNASRVIRITQGQAGLQGSCSGVLVDCYGADSTVWLANLIWMQQRPDNQLRLSTNGQNLRVVIGDVVIAPWKSRDDGPGARQVSFNFWEQ